MTHLKTSFIITITSLLLSGCFNSDSESDEINNAKSLIIAEPCLPVTNNCEITLESDVKLRLQFNATPSYQRLLPVTIESLNATLQGVSISLIIDGEKMPSEAMKSDKGGKYWQAQLLPFADVTNDNMKVRLLVNYKDARYFAEFPIQY